MEPAPFVRRSISIAAVVFIFLAFSGCSDRHSTTPNPRPDKEQTAAENEKRPADAPPNPTSQNIPQNEAPPATDADGKKKASPKADQAKEQPAASQIEAKTEEKHDNAAEKKNAEDDAREKEERPMSDEEIAAATAARRKAALKEIIDKLGPPLVDHPDKLTKMDPDYPVWTDSKTRQVVLQGTICQTHAPLEMFAVITGTKEHEAIVSVPTKAFVVHASLLAIGAKSGRPVEFGPNPGDYKPATGTEIDITVKWKNDRGEVQTARAQEWIKNVKTGKEMEQNWVFGGSGFWKDEQTNIDYYKAEGGDFICVSNFPSAMLDLPIESSQSNDDLIFQANTDRVPPLGTPVTLILAPKLSH